MAMAVLAGAFQVTLTLLSTSAAFGSRTGPGGPETTALVVAVLESSLPETPSAFTAKV